MGAEPRRKPREFAEAELRSLLRENRMCYTEIDYGGFYSEIRFAISEEDPLLFVIGFDKQRAHFRVFNYGYKVIDREEFAVWALSRNLELGFISFCNDTNIPYFESNLLLYYGEQMICKQNFKDIISAASYFASGEFISTSRCVSRSCSSGRQKMFDNNPLWEDEYVELPTLAELLRHTKKGADCDVVGEASFVSSTVLKYDFSDQLVFKLLRELSSKLIRLQSKPPYPVIQFGADLLVKTQLCFSEPVELKNDFSFDWD